ncbi:MAG: hypothetical protein RMH84_03565 [Sulfolobales archaeon]|nr:hypothetical protein [Sulfolobales archaeon]MCX8208030.1 hypothetical protein [Sulfolobales archaeon]MDW8010654.1 hypothetical protein [Sulfolobales archaeon]
MNAAGNADLAKRAYLQAILAVGTWLLISGAIYVNTLERYGYSGVSTLYDAISVSSLIVFIGTLVLMFKLKIETALALSSILLVITYYARLSHIALSRECEVLLLPLVTVVELKDSGFGSLSLDLGQLGLYTLLYLAAKSSIVKAYLKRIK